MIPYRTILALLASIFVIRVLAQFALQFGDIPLLPGFEHWHRATVPYWALFSSQAVILVFMGAAIFALPLKRRRPRLGASLVVLGWIYMLGMLARLVIGAAELSAHAWFDGAISTAFHFVLAAFLLVFGSAVKGSWTHTTPNITRWPRYVGYPVLLVGGYALFSWLVATGAPLLLSSYLAILVAAFGILLHETFAPARGDWRPTRRDVARDSLFLSLVQITLPASLKALALAAIITVGETNAAPLASYWPHDLPILVQVAIMMVGAEFFRYWLHRAMHTLGPLWRLHAVHHASDKLYTVNVGRFHPFDKTLQFLGDTLPFLLLGVGPEVFAAYFVLYALNGFYQHSNADICLGPLNWIIAGPELHRWHHSATLSEAQSNYGNNLIVWDVVFGTRFLPKERELGRIGIENTRWPSGFLAQLLAPFTTSPNTPGRDHSS